MMILILKLRPHKRKNSPLHVHRRTSLTHYQNAGAAHFHSQCVKYSRLLQSACASKLDEVGTHKPGGSRVTHSQFFKNDCFFVCFFSFLNLCNMSKLAHATLHQIPQMPLTECCYFNCFTDLCLNLTRSSWRQILTLTLITFQK